MDWKQMVEEQGITDLTDEQQEFLDRVEGLDFEGFIKESKAMLREKAEEEPMTPAQLTESVWGQSLAIQLLENRVNMFEDTLEMMAVTLEMATRSPQKSKPHDVPDIGDKPKRGGYQN